MDIRTTTIFGWVLGAGIVALGTSIVTGEVFHGERPEKMGYPIEGVEIESSDGAVADQPIAVYLAAADPAAGEQVFKKCQACHNADKGGADQLGPNLWGILGKPHGHEPAFPYSDALKSHPGVWDFDGLNAWLKSPKAYAPGTKMTFAGISKPQDRANVIAFLNQHSDSPQPLPAAPASTDQAKAEAPGAPGAAEKAENEPVLTEGQAAKNPAASVGGEAAPSAKKQ